jgi:hypothetical protein
MLGGGEEGIVDDMILRRQGGWGAAGEFFKNEGDLGVTG